MKSVTYAAGFFPARVFWKQELNLSRADAAYLCQNLHSIVLEREGGSYFYPNEKRTETLCRFEWHRREGKERFKYRIGLMINIADGPLAEIECYITDSKNIANRDLPPLEVPEKILAEAQQETAETIAQAIGRQSSDPSHVFHVVFHLETPYGHGFLHPHSTKCKDVFIRKTKIIAERNRRVSPLILSVKAHNKESARGIAKSKFSLACAVLTLCEKQRFDSASINWSKRQKQPQYISCLESIDDSKLYPSRLKWPMLEETNPNVGQRFDWAWESIECLDNEDRELFVPALFAFYGATVRGIDAATLSVIGYTAALSSLSVNHKEKCDGKLTCSKCDTLNWQHDLKGETAAILDLVTSTCKVESKSDIKEIKLMLQRVYRGQRSAFVHGAQFRHNEFGRGNGFPPSLPSINDIVQETFHYQEDLESLARITRRVLLEWLSDKTGQQFSHALFEITREKYLAKIGPSISVSLPANTMVLIA